MSDSAPRKKHSGLKAGEDFFVAFSPERVKANLVLERLQEFTPQSCGRRGLSFVRQSRGAQTT